MIETLISSKTRIKLLLKFFLNSNTKAYLRGLESEFGESTNAIRLELNRFENAGMLSSYLEGNKKYFSANTNHPLYKEVHNILLKYIGFDKIIENVITRLGNVQRVYVAGDFAAGKDSQIIDLMFVGNIDKVYLVHLIEKVEKLIKRKVRYIIFDSKEDAEEELNKKDNTTLLLWEMKS
jgi:hypothetical protein